MITTLLGGDGTVYGGTVESRAQLPLLLGQYVEPALRIGTITGGLTFHGVDLVQAGATTSAQLPLLLSQLAEVPGVLDIGTIIGLTTVNGVTLTGGSTGTLDIGTITGLTTVHGVDIPVAGFAPTSESAPKIQIRIDLTDPTLPTRTWTDITSHVRNVSIARGGRNHELQRSDAGTMTITLDNRDGQFDHSNNGSPFYGLRRMQWVNVRALWGTRTYSRATMLIETISQTWPGGGYDATAQLTCVDAMKVLALLDLEGQTFPIETSGARVQRVLDLAGLEGDIETGQSTLVAVTEPLPEGSMALEHLRAVEETENGQLFVDADGIVVFHDRHHRVLDLSTPLVLGDAAGEIPYVAARLDTDDASIWNTVRVTTAANEIMEVEDATSKGRYYERRLNRQLLTADANEAQAAAEYLLLLYANPADRLPAIGLVGQNSPTTWPSILGMGNSARVTWKRRPATETPARTISKSAVVERVTEQATPNGVWQTTVEVSPADPFELWLLGDATRGVLGTSTQLAY